MLWRPGQGYYDIPFPLVYYFVAINIFKSCTRYIRIVFLDISVC